MILIPYIFLKVICLFLAVLGLRCCEGFSLVAPSRGYSSWCAQASHGRRVSCCGAPALGMQTSVAAAPRLQSTGSVVGHTDLVAL